jgi:rubrerythrin
MIKTLKGTETEKNLLLAFAGESQARNKYTYFSGVARKEGLMQISAIFLETAEQEKEHAKRFFKFLEGGDVTISTNYSAGEIGSTLDNLLMAAAGENEEWSELYPKFANTAEKEGFQDIAETFRKISIAEKQHEKQYMELADNLKNGTVFKKGHVIIWRCRNCGFIHESKEAPEKCPACLHPQAYFEVLSENW